MGEGGVFKNVTWHFFGKNDLFSQYWKTFQANFWPLEWKNICHDTPGGHSGIFKSILWSSNSLKANFRTVFKIIFVSKRHITILYLDSGSQELNNFLIQFFLKARTDNLSEKWCLKIWWKVQNWDFNTLILTFILVHIHIFFDLLIIGMSKMFLKKYNFFGFVFFSA